MLINDKICITLDYELCLGKNTGTVHNTMIKPMEELSKVFDKYDVKATLFVDASFLLALKKNKSNYSSLEKDYELIVNQLTKLQTKGYSIQLHIHPQWLFSTYDGKKWNLDFEHYKLSDLNKIQAKNHFKEAKDLLQTITKKEIIAFRAGGFSLQSFNGYYDLLIDNKISIDSSVVPGTFEKSKSQWYDYRSALSRKYIFKNDIIKPDPDGKITEVPISVVKYNPFFYAYLRKKVESENTFNLFTEGEGIGALASDSIRFWRIFKQFFSNKVVSASIDGFMSVLLPIVYSKFKENKGNDIFLIIGHPKSASTTSIFYTEKFIQLSINNNHFVSIEDLI
jgi:peptidoglycan/xylan/chitin deacetylase (PgdA/CDA1 family)